MGSGGREDELPSWQSFGSNLECRQRKIFFAQVKPGSFAEMSGSEGVEEKVFRVPSAMFTVRNGDHVRRWKETFELLGQHVSNLTKLVNEKKESGGKIQAAVEAAKKTFERLRKLDKKVRVSSLHRESVGAQTTPSLMRSEPITPQGPEEAEYTSESS
uniref:Uncharacterized protein n=1 Tax=Bracon brevicornis TaxID=1563983 RepID=A0A6V7JM66_9HYME